ncbi:MAG TPA: cytochrome c biogenesis protein CcsA [Chthoniobacteraceae bacterium]|jgi:ABC-type transport system involved in cytochrome c biogenesis permease subunit
MKNWLTKWLPLIIAALFAAWLLSSIRQTAVEGFAAGEFGRLPILSGGRRQPIDSLARNSLLQLRGKQTAAVEPWKGRKSQILTATEWLMEVLMSPTVANMRPVFRVDHPDLKGLLGLPLDKTAESDAKHFSWNQISIKSEALLTEMKRVSQIPTANRNPFDKAVHNLWRATFLYQQLQSTLAPPDAKDWGAEYEAYVKNRDPGRAAAQAQNAGKEHDKAAFDRIMADVSRFDRTEQLDELGKSMSLRIPLLIPPVAGDADEGWQRSSAALIDIARGGEPNPALRHFAALTSAYRSGDTAAFNRTLATYRGEIAGRLHTQLRQARHEQFFNHLQLFYKAMILFISAFLFAVIFWFKPERWDWLRRTAVWLAFLGVLVTTVGIAFRMALIGRPPVINLYSSAVFIAWGAPLLGLLLERFWRNSIGVVVGSMIAALSLIIAHYLSLEGDTLEMLRAVLDTNFWLATHVVIVTLGYASTFVAGFLGIIFVVRGLFTRSVTPELRRSLARMVYGIVCFATLFSFVGTVLGGIWADQSWGRFWGWDPKENGAIIIVLWNALILHARWGGLVRERGLLNLAIGGNIVTSWSWFGTNMLGIGLHSYGFMDAAFYALLGFDLLNLAIIGLGLLPERFWRSYGNPPSVQQAAPQPV